MEDFFVLYNLFNIDLRIAIVSLTKPEGRHANYLLGAKKLTVEQLVGIGVFFLIPFDKIRRSIDYDGDDYEVQCLLSEGYIG